MKMDAFADQLHDLATGFAHGNAARQIRDVRAKTGLALFHDDEKFHWCS
jgi:hypothetical protein